MTTHAARMRARACWQPRLRSAARNRSSCVLLCGLKDRSSQLASLPRRQHEQHTTDGAALGTVGSQGVAQAPIADAGTAGTVGCEVRAGASDAEGCGMDASGVFEVVERTAALELSPDDMTGVDAGVSTAGNEDSAGACATTARTYDGTDVAAAGSGDWAGAGMVQEARSAIAGDAETRDDSAPVAPGRQEGPGGLKKRRRGECDTDTAGTAELEVHARASGAEGRGMDASGDFEAFATRSEPVPGAAWARSARDPAQRQRTRAVEWVHARSLRVRVMSMATQAGAAALAWLTGTRVCLASTAPPRPSPTT